MPSVNMDLTLKRKDEKEKVTVGLFFCVVIMISSCVQGDLYDLYEDEDLSVNGCIPKTKNWLDDWWQVIINGRVKDDWIENECGLWALMCMNNNTEDSKVNRLYHMRKIAHSVDATIDDNSSERDVCVAYYGQIGKGGISNGMLEIALNSTIGYLHYDKYNSKNQTQLNNFWSVIGIQPPDYNITSVNELVIVQQRGVHYGVLESIEDGEIKMSTHGDEISTCELNEVGFFYVKK